MPSSRVYVKDSSIHGKGLFAKTDISAGTVIGEVVAKSTIDDGPHVLWLDDSEDSGVEVVCDFRFINHSKQPNACYYDDLTVVALRDIGKDEEITHHYGDGWDEEE